MLLEIKIGKRIIHSEAKLMRCDIQHSGLLLLICADLHSEDTVVINMTSAEQMTLSKELEAGNASGKESIP